MSAVERRDAARCISRPQERFKALSSIIEDWPGRSTQAAALAANLAPVVSTTMSAPLILQGPPCGGKRGLLRATLKAFRVRYVWLDCSQASFLSNSLDVLNVEPDFPPFIFASFSRHARLAGQPTPRPNYLRLSLGHCYRRLILKHPLLHVYYHHLLLFQLHKKYKYNNRLQHQLEDILSRAIAHQLISTVRRATC